MKSIKKITSLILAILFILSLVSCGTLNPAINSDSDTDTETQTDTDTSGGGGIGTETDTETENETFGDETGYSDSAFTVALRYNGVKYIPSSDVVVTWKNGSTLETSTLNSKGYAGSERLDGDYKVTISGLPSDKVYNPNIYEATNDKRNIIIDIRDFGSYTGRGKDPYNGIRLSKVGVYSVTLKDAKEIVSLCREKGVLVLTAKTKVRLLPPLNITMEELTKAVNVIKECVK